MSSTNGLVETPRRNNSDVPPGEIVIDQQRVVPLAAQTSSDAVLFQSGGKGSIVAPSRSNNGSNNTSLAGPNIPILVGNGKAGGTPPIVKPHAASPAVTNSSIINTGQAPLSSATNNGGTATTGTSTSAGVQHQNIYNFVQTCSYKGSNGRLYTRQQGIMFNSAAHSMHIAWRHIESITTGSQNTGGHCIPYFTIKVRTDKPHLAEEFAYNECPGYKAFVKKEAQHVSEVVTDFVTTSFGTKTDGSGSPVAGTIVSSGAGSDPSPATSMGQATEVRSLSSAIGTDPLVSSSNLGTARSEMIEEMMLTLRRELDTNSNAFASTTVMSATAASINKDKVDNKAEGQRVTPRSNAHQRLISTLSDIPLDVTLRGGKDEPPSSSRNNLLAHARRGSDQTSINEKASSNGASQTPEASSPLVPPAAHPNAKGAGGSSNASFEPAPIAFTRTITGSSLLGPISTIALVAGTDDEELSPSGTYTFAVDSRGGDAHVAAASLKAQMGTHFIELCTLAVEQRKYDLIAVAKGITASQVVESAAAIQLEFSSQCNSQTPKSLAEFYNCIVGAAVTAFRNPNTARGVRSASSNASRSVWGPRLSEFAPEVVQRMDASVYSNLLTSKSIVSEPSKAAAGQRNPPAKMDPSSFPVLYQTNGAGVVAAPKRPGVNNVTPSANPEAAATIEVSSGSSTSATPQTALPSKEVESSKGTLSIFVPNIGAIITLLNQHLLMPVCNFLARNVVPKGLVTSKRRRVLVARYTLLFLVALVFAGACYSVATVLYVWAVPPPNPTEIAAAKRKAQLATAERALEKIMFGGQNETEIEDGNQILLSLLGEEMKQSHHTKADPEEKDFSLTPTDLTEAAKRVALGHLTNVLGGKGAAPNPLNFEYDNLLSQHSNSNYNYRSSSQTSLSLFWSPTFLLIILALVILMGSIGAKLM